MEIEARINKRVLSLVLSAFRGDITQDDDEARLAREAT